MPITERAVGTVGRIKISGWASGKNHELSMLLDRFGTLGALVFSQAADNIHGAAAIESPTIEVDARYNGVQTSVFEEQVARIELGRRDVSDQMLLKPGSTVIQFARLEWQRRYALAHALARKLAGVAFPGIRRGVCTRG